MTWPWRPLNRRRWRDALLSSNMPSALREASARWAKDLLDGGHRQEALDRARQEALHPGATIDSLMQSRNVFLRVGDQEAVEAVESRLRAKWPDRPEGYVYAAHRLIGDDRCEEAFTLAMQSLRMEELSGLHPSRPRAWPDELGCAWVTPPTA